MQQFVWISFLNTDFDQATCSFQSPLHPPALRVTLCWQKTILEYICTIEMSKQFHMPPIWD